MMASAQPNDAPPAGTRDLQAEASRWRRLTAALPMRLALVAVGGVWVLGCVWSFTEQTAFAASRGFGLPQLLPLVIDGFAIAMAGVAWAASLDARPALAARAATLCAVAGSAGSNGAWAWLRADHDTATVALAVAVPVAANIAFEVLLGELRRQVQRRRGLPAPAAIPYPRFIRVILAPGQTLTQWRRLVLELTSPPTHAPAEIALTGPAPTPRISHLEPAETRPASLDAPAAGSSKARALAVVPTPPITVRHDRRAVLLAHRLDEVTDPDAVTGAMVTELLGTEITPRTGRRLLAQARALRAAPGRRRPPPNPGHRRDHEQPIPAASTH